MNEPIKPTSPATLVPIVSERWLIHKSGRGWYRPNAEGYTNNLAEAGRYTHSKAMEHSHPNGWDGPRDGMIIKHESEVHGAMPATPATDIAAELAEALRAILGPLNVCSDNPHVRNDAVLPVDMTMGEVRQARAALAKWEASQ